MLARIIGVLAIMTGTMRLIPQIIKSYKTKKVNDLSLVWEALGIFSSLLWGGYGYLKGDTILITGALIVSISYVILVFQKKAYG